MEKIIGIKQITLYKPADGLLAGFFASLCSYIPGIIRAVYVHQSRYRGIIQYAQPTRACIVQSAQIPTCQFLPYELDHSNFLFFPAYTVIN